MGLFRSTTKDENNKTIISFIIKNLTIVFLFWLFLLFFITLLKHSFFFLMLFSTLLDSLWWLLGVKAFPLKSFVVLFKVVGSNLLFILYIIPVVAIIHFYIIKSTETVRLFSACV